MTVRENDRSSRNRTNDLQLRTSSAVPTIRPTKPITNYLLHIHIYNKRIRIHITLDKINIILKITELS